MIFLKFLHSIFSINKNILKNLFHFQDITALPEKLVYKLRFPSESRTPKISEPLIFNWHTNLLYPLFSTGGPRALEDNSGGMPFYFQDGFVPVQDAIARSYTKQKCAELNNCENAVMPNIKLQRYPYPPYILDVLLQGLETIVSFFILLSFIYPTINTVRFIAIEKERQLKEAMKIMGLPNWLHWSSWFVRTMAFMIISISFIVGLLKVSIFFLSNIIHRLLTDSHFILDSNVRFIGCGFHKFRLVNDLGIFIGVQYFNDNVLLYA